jgi:hypothetical protein
MSVVGIVLLVIAVALLVVFELDRRGKAAGGPRLHRPSRPRKRHLRVVEPDGDHDEFQRAVERDLANLPTYDPRAKRD